MTGGNAEWKGVGRVRLLLDAARAEPERIFIARDAARIMQCKVDHVTAAIKYAVANRALFCKSFGRGVPMLISGSPIAPEVAATFKQRPAKTSQTWKEGGTHAAARWATDPDDPRIGKVVPGWFPPVMRHVRGGA